MDGDSVGSYEFAPRPRQERSVASEHTTRPDSRSSMRTDTTWRYSIFGPNRQGKGSVLFTGPDGIRDHRVSVDSEHRYVGDGTMSPEGTSEADYLWRAPSHIPFPRPKSRCVGEIGWGVPTSDPSSARSGAQIALGQFRQAVEDRHTHRLQNAWYPGPNDEFPENSDAGMVMNVYKRKQTAANRPQRNTTSQGGREASNQTRRSSTVSSSSHHTSHRGSMY